MKDCCNSIANAMELLQSCVRPSICIQPCDRFEFSYPSTEVLRSNQQQKLTLANINMNHKTPMSMTITKGCYGQTASHVGPAKCEEPWGAIINSRTNCSCYWCYVAEMTLPPMSMYKYIPTNISHRYPQQPQICWFQENITDSYVHDFLKFTWKAAYIHGLAQDFIVLPMEIYKPCAKPSILLSKI